MAEGFGVAVQVQVQVERVSRRGRTLPNPLEAASTACARKQESQWAALSLVERVVGRQVRWAAEMAARVLVSLSRLLVVRP